MAAALLALMAPSAAHAITNGGRRPATPTSARSSSRWSPRAASRTCCSSARGRWSRARGAHREPLHGPRRVRSRLGHRVVHARARISDGNGLGARRRPHAPQRDAGAAPGYTGKANYRYDVGAFVLDAPVSGVPPPSWPRLGYLDQKSLRGTVVHHRGLRHRARRQDEVDPVLPAADAADAGDPAAGQRPPRLRPVLDEPRPRPRRHVLRRLRWPALQPAGEVVAVTTTGDIPCKASDQSSRIDTTTPRSSSADASPGTEP